MQQKFEKSIKNYKNVLFFILHGLWGSVIIKRVIKSE